MQGGPSRTGIAGIDFKAMVFNLTNRAAEGHILV